MTGAVKKTRPFRRGLFQYVLEKVLNLAISFGGHDGSAKIVCRILGRVRGGGIGQGPGSRAELLANGRIVDWRIGGGVGFKEEKQVGMEVGVIDADVAEKSLALLRREFDSLAKCGFYLFVAIWRHFCFFRNCHPRNSARVVAVKRNARLRW